MDLNSTSQKINLINNCDIIYFIYFIILIAIIYLIYKFIYSENNTYNSYNTYNTSSTRAQDSSLIDEYFNNIQSTNTTLTKSNVCPEITSMLGQEQKFNNIKEN